ncbi:MAG: glycosyltransferase family 2 protein [Minisyncoccia bacterium]
MKLSIIIPAYNEENYIVPTLQSLNNQSISRKDYEIIVVDNNSIDKTAELARLNYADKVIVEKQQGTNICRNTGYKNARGEILVFVDADSIAPFNYLENIILIFQKNKNIVAVSGPYDYGFKGAQKYLEYFYSNYILPIVPKILHFIFRKKAGIIIGGNFAVFKKVLDQIGGIPPLKFWGDDATLAMIISRKIGEVKFDQTLRIKSSPRRFKQIGFFKLAFLYAFAYFKAYFSNI